LSIIAIVSSFYLSLLAAATMASAGLHYGGFFGIRLVLSLGQARELELLAYVMGIARSFPDTARVPVPLGSAGSRLGWDFCCSTSSLGGSRRRIRHSRSQLARRASMEAALG
jgi:hypothetical protein